MNSESHVFIFSLITLVKNECFYSCTIFCVLSVSVFVSLPHYITPIAVNFVHSFFQWMLVIARKLAVGGADDHHRLLLASKASPTGRSLSSRLNRYRKNEYARKGVDLERRGKKTEICAVRQTRIFYYSTHGSLNKSC